MSAPTIAPATAPEFTSWTRQAQARAAHEPAWLRARRERAAAVAGALPVPDRRAELWRRTDFGVLDWAALKPFATPAPHGFQHVPDAVRARLGDAPESAAALVQRNATVVWEHTPDALARQGVVVCDIARALREFGERIEPRLHSLIDTDHDLYTALQQAVHEGGAFVWVPDGVALDTPIRLFQWLDGEGAVNAPASVIVIGRGAHATVIEELVSEGAHGAAFHLGSSEVWVGDDARLVYGHLQEWGPNVVHYSNQRAHVGRNAELQWIQTMLGGRTTKTNSYWSMTAPGGQVYVHGFMFGDRRQHLDLHTLQKHLADHCTSDLLIKTCLKDRARSIYQGLIQVAEGAQRTDAYQANRNLLLSDTARADSIPGLEILANDVRCTHGATIGNVDEEQMFYLMARGLPRNEAQRLIVEGFFAPVLDRIPLEGVRDRLRGAIQHKIG
ncbi:MAG TPA: Fe-S cluster assembly protein SufD [Candidatus Eisenbacteria bacterium]|nr:Fe-S cluster assembly protein SufD [Candidatus Eisenbacteria bacterium]